MIMVWAERGEQMAAGQFDDTVQVLGDVKAAGVPCYALSNMEPDAFRVRRARFPFMNWFDAHVISGLEGVAKPDRRIFEILLHRHGLRPQAWCSSTTRPATSTPPASSASSACTSRRRRGSGRT